MVDQSIRRDDDKRLEEDGLVVLVDFDDAEQDSSSCSQIEDAVVDCFVSDAY